MSDIKSILVHFDPSARSAARLRLAVTLAERHGARMTAIFAATSAAMTAALAMGEGSGLLATAAIDIDAERLKAAREAFDTARGSTPIAWTELTDPVPALAVARAALTHDLVVLGQGDPDERSNRLVPADFVESVVVESGKPALVVPYAGSFPRVGRRVLVAWKTTRESARALTAALPLLQRADRVDVIAWGNDLREINPFLLGHGIEAQFHHDTRAGAGEIGQLLLSRACDFEADLLVMGCYGHSRAREFVLGGVTRTVLESMTLPVLMAH